MFLLKICLFFCRYLDVFLEEVKKLMEFCEYDGIFYFYGFIM